MTFASALRIAGFVALLPLAACGSNPTDPMAATVPVPAPTVPSTSVQDQTFATQAATSDMFEIQSSQLALQKSKSRAIRAFAQRMIDDHTTTSQKLMALAPAKGITLPTILDTKQSQTLSSLEAADRGFDRAYVAAQVSGHRDTAAAFRAEIASGTDPDLKMAASDTLPMIQNHLRDAQRLRTR